MVNPAVIYAAVPISVVVAVGLLRKWRASRWGKCVSNTCLRGKTFLITGANSGIGLETAKALINRKARVIFACRDLDNAKKVIADIRKNQPNGGEMIPMQLDLASLESIEKFVDVVKAGFHKIDVLINNAGVAVPVDKPMTTKEGFEIHFGVNHLGHFYLTNLLIDLLKRASPSRVVIVSSMLHEQGTINLNDLNQKNEPVKPNARHNPAYCNSKLMNVYFARALADRLKNTGVDVNACCPGWTYTNLFRYTPLQWYKYVFMLPIALLFMRSAQQGAQTVIHCATDYSIEGKTGKFYKDCAEYTSKIQFDKDIETKLWNATEEIIKARKPL